MKIIIVHIKMYKSNYFIIVSNSYGQILFTTNSGSLGFKNIEKRSLEAFSNILSVVLKYLLSIKKDYIFLKLEGIKEAIINDIYKQFIILIKKYNMSIIGFKIINKIAHNGCRKKG